MKVKCPYCDGSGEIPSIWLLEGPDMEGCPCCKGEGIVDKDKSDRFIKMCAEETE